MRNPGKILRTEKGNIVIVRNTCKLINGKVTAELCDDKYNVQKDVEGRTRNLLVDPNTLTLIGFVD